jgi:hypothetical protein
MEVKARGLRRPVHWRGDLYLPPVFQITEDHPTLPFTVEIVAEVNKGEVSCASLKVNKKEGGPPVVARHLRVLSLPYMLEKGAMAIALKGEEVEGSISLEPALSPGDVFDVRATKGLTAAGRPPLDDDFYAEVSESYNAAFEAGNVRHSDRLRAMAYDEGRWGRIVPYKTLDRWVRTAMAKGLIEKGATR